MVDAGLDLPSASLIQPLGNLVSLLFLVPEAIRGRTGLVTCQFCRAIHNTTFAGVIFEDIIYHHIQVVGFFLRFWNHFVVKIFPIQRR